MSGHDRIAIKVIGDALRNAIDAEKEFGLKYIIGSLKKYNKWLDTHIGRLEEELNEADK